MTIDGKRIAVTRPRSARGDDALATTVAARGGIVVSMPLLALVNANSAPVIAAVQGGTPYRALLLTSQNAVPAVVHAFNSTGILLPPAWVVGPATAKAAELAGIAVEIVADDYRAEGLLRSLEDIALSGARLLFPRAKEARQLLVDSLRARGAIVDVIVAYETVPSAEQHWRAGLKQLKRGEVDVLTFTSASAVDQFAKIIGADDWHVPCVATIGPVTTDACERHGITVDVCPERYTFEAMLDAVELFLSS